MKNELGYEIEKYLLCNVTKYEDGIINRHDDILHVGSMVHLASSIIIESDYMIVDFDDKCVKIYDVEDEEFETCDYGDFALALYGINDCRDCTIGMSYKIFSNKPGKCCIEKIICKLFPNI